jgi:hypothetical protein
MTGWRVYSSVPPASGIEIAWGAGWGGRLRASGEFTTKSILGEPTR